MQTKALRAAGDQAGDDLRCTFCGKDNRETLSIRLWWNADALLSVYVYLGS